MPGTLLLDDLHDAVQNQLTDYANQLGSAAQSAQQAIPQIQTPDAPDPNQILAELQQHAADAAQAVQQQTQQITQPALQVLGQGAQAAGGAVTQLGGNVSQAQDQLAQQLVQHAQDANDTRQQLQDHAATVLGSTDTTQPAGVQSLAVPTPPPTLGAASGDQTTPALGGTTGPVTQPATTSAAAATPDRSMSLQDYARAAAQKAGVDPNVFVAQIQQESGFDPTAKSAAGAIGIAQFMPGTAAGMNVDPTDPYAALDAAAQMDAQNLKKYGGDYSKTLAAYNAGGGAVDQYGGVPPYQETQSYVSTILGNAQKAAQAAGTTISNAVGGTASALGSAAQTALGGTPPSDAGGAPASNGYVFPVQGFKGPVQDHWGSVKGGSDLMAPRGTPIVVMAPGVVDESGYNQVGGNSLEIKGDDGNEYYYAHFDAPTALKVGQRVDAGTYVAPVGDTGDAAGGPTHLHIGIGPNILLGADKYGGTGGDYNAVGLLQSTLDGTPPPSQTPTATAPGRTTPPTLGGTSDATPNAPVTMGDNQPAAPLNVDQGNGPTPIQSAQDVAGGAASALGGVANDALEQAKQALQQAQDALGRVAQGAQQAAAPVLGAAQQAVSGAAQDVQQAAQGALGAAQDLNRQTPGRAALNAATPVLGAAASDVGATARGAADVLGQTASDVGAGAQQTAQNLGTAVQGAADTAGQTLGGAAASADQVRQQVQDTINSLPSNATVAQARQTIGNTLDTLGPRALQIAGDLPLPMGGTVSDLANVGRGVQAGLQTIEEQRQAGITQSDPVQQFQDNVDAARRGDWGAFAQGTLALAQRPFEPIMGGPSSDLSPSVSAALTAGGIDPNAARVLGQVANVIGPMALERAIPEIVSAASRGADAAATAGLEAIDRLAPPELASATTRRAGESADEYLARLSDEAAGQRPSAAAAQVVPTPEPGAGLTGTEPAVAVPSNPYDLLRAAPEPNAAPLSGDEVLTHLEQLDQQHTANDARIAELQNRLSAGPRPSGDFSGTVVRPPWGAGWTNQGLEELARRNNLNPYEANWWERGNFVPGTGEMREDVGQSGIAGSPQYRGAKRTQQSPTDMRAELVRLQSDQAQIDAAHDAIWEHADQGGDLYARPTAEALPFDSGGPDTGATPAPQGVAPANAEAASVRGEAGASVSGTPGAAEPTVRAESTPAELTAGAAPADVATEMQRNFLRDHRIVPNSDPRPQTTSLGLPNVKGVDQASLAEEVGPGVDTLYHETSVPNARALLDRIEQGPRTLAQVYTADNRDLALGQGGRGVMLEFDPTRVNGSANANPVKQAGAAVGAGTEYTVDRSLPGAVKAIVVRNQRQADQLATNPRVAARFDFANATPAEGGGLRIPYRPRTAATPAVLPSVVTPETTGFRAPETSTPTAAETAVSGARAAPGETLTATTPTARVTARVGAARATTPEAVTAAAADAAGVPLRAAVDPVAAHAEYAPNSATPLDAAVGHQATSVVGGAGDSAAAPGTPLERINAMYAEKPGAPGVVQRIANGRTAVVRALTDRGVDIADAQQQYAKELGRPLNADELMYEMSRLQPGPAAEARVQQDLAPIVRSVGNDYQALRNFVTARSNIQVADAVGTDILRTQADANIPTSLRDKVNATQTSLRMRQDALNALQNASVPDDARVAAARRSVNSAQRTLDRAQAAVETARQAVLDRAAQSGAEASANRMFSGGVSKADSQTAIDQIQAELGPERFAKVQQAADQLSRYGQSLRQTLVDSGVLSEDQANGMLAKYPDWVKTRILKYMDEQTGGGQGQGQKIGLSSQDVHKYTVAGTAAAREDPIASMVAYTYQVERMAQKNNTFNALVKLDEASPNPQLRQVSSDFSPTAAQSTVQGFVDGTKQRYVTDNKALGQAIEGAAQTALPGFLTWWTNVFRALAASRNPAFVAGHASFTIPQYLLRQTAIEGGPTSLPRVIGALAQGYADVFQGFLQGKPLGEAGPGTQQLLRGGGGQFGALSGTAEDAAKAVRQMGGIDISKPAQALNLVKNLVTLKPVENLVNRVDYGPRVAAMRLAEARGAHPVQAIIAGRDATIDFNRGGTATKLLSQMIPFLNVGVQGPLQVARTFRDNPKAAIYTVGTLLGAPTLAAEIWNNADPQRAKDYADVPQYIKDQGIVIMLPTEAPVDAQGDRHPQFVWINTRNWTPFVSATREAADVAMGTNTHTWSQAAASMMSSALPVQANNPSDFAQKLALSAPGVQTIAQLSLNKDFYRGSDIVTKRADVGASPTSQFLTPGLQQVANVVAPGSEVRPSAVDFAIRNIGAGTAGAALSGTDAALRAAGYPPAQVSRPTAAGASEIPGAGSVIGRFVRGQTGQELQTARSQVMTPQALQTLRSNGITITPAPDTSSVNQIPLKLDEETRYQQLTNQYVDQAIARTAASPSFANMTQVGKQSLMSQAISAARQKAGIEVLNTIPAAEKARRLKTKSTAPAVAA